VEHARRPNFHKIISAWVQQEDRGHGCSRWCISQANTWCPWCLQILTIVYLSPNKYGPVYRSFLSGFRIFWSWTVGFIDCLANHMPSLYRIFAEWSQIQQFFKVFR
jgi:hypothetical protein